MANDLISVVDELKLMEPQLRQLLPPDISVETFMMVARTALEQSPELLSADRHSLFLACKDAAKDGLLPDKKQGALVIYKANVGSKEKPQWIQKVQWMRMRQGLVDKAAKIGINLFSAVVYEKDRFSYQLGDDPLIDHSPCFSGDRGGIVGVYAIATLPNGLKHREFIHKDELEKARAVAKTDYVWSTWTGEMARKTALHRLFKSIPDTFIPALRRHEFEPERELINIETGEVTSKIEGPKSKSKPESEPQPEQKPEKKDDPKVGTGQLKMMRIKLGQQDQHDEAAVCTKFVIEKFEDATVTQGNEIIKFLSEAA